MSQVLKNNLNKVVSTKKIKQSHKYSNRSANLCRDGPKLHPHLVFLWRYGDQFFFLLGNGPERNEPRLRPSQESGYAICSTRSAREPLRWAELNHGCSFEMLVFFFCVCLQSAACTCTLVDYIEYWVRTARISQIVYVSCQAVVIAVSVQLIKNCTAGKLGTHRSQFVCSTGKEHVSLKHWN